MTLRQSPLFLLSVITLLTLCSASIPQFIEGYSRGSDNPILHIEAYYDLLCPDSQNQWNILEPLLKNTYHITTNQTLRFTIHLIPLPYHLHAHPMIQGAKIIAANQATSNDIYTYFDVVFKNQAEYGTNATLEKSQQQVFESLTQKVVQALPYTSPYFLNDLAPGNNFDTQARVSWSYAMYNRVTGTPMFFANGVAINGAINYVELDWIKFINGGYVAYLEGQSQYKKFQDIF